MRALQTIASFAVLIGIGWVIMKVRDGFWKGAAQHVLARGAHAEGQALTNEYLTIDTHLDPQRAQAVVVDGLKLPAKAPSTLSAELYQGLIKPGYVEFCAGTKLGTHFVAAMWLTPGDRVTRLKYTVVRWSSSDGIVTCLPQMRYLRRRIEEELLAADPSATVSTSQSEPSAHAG